MLTLTSGANISVSNSVVAQGTGGGIYVDDGTLGFHYLLLLFWFAWRCHQYPGTG